MEEKNNVQVTNTPSIEYILRPITYTSWLLGVGIARPRNSSKAIMIIKRVVYLVVYIVHQIYYAIRFVKFNNEFATGSSISELVYILAIVTFYVLAYYSAYDGIKQYGKWPELMDKINELDQKIRKQIPINDRPVKNLVILAILTTLVWCPLALIVYVLYYYFTNSEISYVSAILNIFVEVPFFISNFVFNIIVYVIYYRFKTINKLIGQLNKSLSDPSWITLKVRRIRELHTGICHLVSMINDIYGLYLLFHSMNCFVAVTCTLFIIYEEVLAKNYPYTLINCIFCIIKFGQFGLMCRICTLAHQESDKIGRSIYEIIFNRKFMNLGKINETKIQSSLEIYPPFEDSDSEQNSSSGHNLNYSVFENLSRRNLDRDCVRKEINDFLVQLQQSRVAFTACDYFEINNALFSGFVGTIITYLIIFIQLYQRPKNLDENVNSRMFTEK
ncbi:uncharacterized protein LOC120357952 [Solenopsis invicta]|uniref:uncharacterized protein LOC120357952 n=1 Tax=Solenopsis invicta TaxID=13686 RepID=UPI00193D0F5B|nr:uncharacterized protein LOC120357952 [Solenopsis invicta]